VQQRSCMLSGAACCEFTVGEANAPVQIHHLSTAQ
jgi:hypothetical protein